ncbi:hypothetical protein VU01_10344 [Candidatus Electrothrix marina]|uniref:Uncharacterized protein n=1 Tax=Candidatus Electrothrix marina TaxID=1859130 RepID=A0A3S3QPH4_9BACT|nr:hypothetical protein VU00_10283 [Candidatus Electrothrix marina]RWX52155.1 hypothetical protein VU01_10344 [Candidatus Electrothrix marina]
MKQAITVGLIVAALGGGSLLIWKVHWQDPAEYILIDSDSAAVEKVQPFMPPVIELVNEQQPAAESGEYPDPDTGERGGGSYEQNILDVIFHAEKKADLQALKVLQIGREMSLENRELVLGGCWNYVDTVYNRAGYTGEQRRVVFQRGEETGQYADQEMIRPGDWLFYISHDYREARHSAIFIDWINYEKHIGLMLSYGGEERGEPARYSAYNLSRVYNIVRPLKE